MDELKGRSVIARKRGYGPDYVDLFIKQRKKDMREFARQRGICNPIDVGLNKWGLERRRTLEEERARKEAREETRVQMQVLNEHVVALCVSECFKAFFSLPDSPPLRRHGPLQVVSEPVGSIWTFGFTAIEPTLLRVVGMDTSRPLHFSSINFP